MKSLLKNIKLSELLNLPIMFDANIFMVGIEYRSSEPNCSFENMAKVYIEPLLESFTDIRIHEVVYNELDDKSRNLINKYIDKNVTIVNESNLYGTDPIYTDIFNKISSDDLVQYKRGNSKDAGEVYSLAYAAYYKINYFSSKEVMVELISNTVDVLNDVNIITFDIILLVAYIYFGIKNDSSNNKAIRSIYKRFCDDVIKRHKLPKTFREYFDESKNYI